MLNTATKESLVGARKPPEHPSLGIVLSLRFALFPRAYVFLWCPFRRPQPPFQLRAMANTPQPFAGNCRYASSPYRLPCRGQGILSNPWNNPSRIFQCLEKDEVQAQPASNPWNDFFQGLEKQTPFFPMLGKRSRKISNVWKHFFQPLERRDGILPTFGWNPSRPRKTARTRGPGWGPALRAPRSELRSATVGGAVKDARVSP